MLSDGVRVKFTGEKKKITSFFFFFGPPLSCSAWYSSIFFLGGGGEAIHTMEKKFYVRDKLRVLGKDAVTVGRWTLRG